MSARRWLAAIAAGLLLSVLAMALAAPAQAHTPYVAKAWGRNNSGQLGDGTNTGPEECTGVACSTTPVAVSGLSGVTALAGGGDHTLALLEGSGTVMAWGNNGAGQLGDGTTTNSDAPAPVCQPGEVAPCANHLAGVLAVAAGSEHSLALLSNGKVLAWGANGFGQLGDGSTASSGVPVEVKGLAEAVTAIAASNKHSLALLASGKVMVWGAGGLGNGEGSSDVPVAVCAPEEAVPCTRQLEGVSAIAAGGGHSLALLSGGKVLAWGDNAEAQLGDGTTSERLEPAAAKAKNAKGELVPLEGVASLASGRTFSLAALKSGAVVAWGSNVQGQLGQGSSHGPEECGTAPTTFSCSRSAVVVSGLSEATAISAGEQHALALLRNARVKAWGLNGEGQLGIDSTGPEACFLAGCSTKPVTVCAQASSVPSCSELGPFLENVKGIATGSQFSLAVVEPPPPPTSLPELGRCVKVKKGTGEWLGNQCQNVAPGRKGSYNWLPGAAAPKFSATAEGIKEGQPILLETAGGTKAGHLINCQVAINEGEYTGAKSLKETLLLIGCTLVATHQSCQTNPAPQKEGEIEFSAEGKLGFIKGGEKPSAGWDLSGISVFVTCGQPPEATSLSDRLTGSVIAPVAKQSVMVKEMTLLYKSFGGTQVPERFEGEPLDVLSSEFTNSKFERSTEQTGLKAKELIVNGEPLEIKVKCLANKLPCK